MISFACLRARSPAVRYVVAAAEDLPFRNVEFAAVTAFSSFHWFANARAMSEVSRVLLPGGPFLVVNRNESGKFRERYRRVIQRFVDGPLPDAKKHYDPAALLRHFAFERVTRRVFAVRERATVDETLRYAHTISLFNLVPARHRAEALTGLTNFLRRESSGGMIEREIEIVAVAGLRSAADANHECCARAACRDGRGSR
jgi:SAM-dependent methyltransferase